jgi:hypothetical protein
LPTEVTGNLARRQCHETRFRSQWFLSGSHSNRLLFECWHAQVLANIRCQELWFRILAGAWHLGNLVLARNTVQDSETCSSQSPFALAQGLESSFSEKQWPKNPSSSTVRPFGIISQSISFSLSPPSTFQPPSPPSPLDRWTIVSICLTIVESERWTILHSLDSSRNWRPFCDGFGRRVWMWLASSQKGCSFPVCDLEFKAHWSNSLRMMTVSAIWSFPLLGVLTLMITVICLPRWFLVIGSWLSIHDCAVPDHHLTSKRSIGLRNGTTCQGNIFFRWL